MRALVLLMCMLCAASGAWGARLVGDETVPAAQTPAAVAAPEQPAPENETQYVTMDFDGVDIKVFIKFIADTTGENFIIDDKVRGKVTVLSPRKMTIDEAYQVFLSVLEVNGFSTVPSGSVTKVMKSSEAITRGVETGVDGAITREDQLVTRIIPLKYAAANDMRTLLSPLMSKGTSQILAYPQSNVLIVTDTKTNIAKIMDILKVVDVTGFAQEVRLVELENANATDLSTKLTQILADNGKTKTTRTSRTRPGVLAGKAPSKIIPYERTNSLIIMASGQDMDDILKLVEQLDVPTPTGKEGIQVYYLQYANAEDLAKVLGEMPAPTTPADPKAKAASKSQPFKISADKETNSLIIYADPDTYRSIVETIKYLDIPRKQVYVKALIMEVNTTKDFKVGVQWTAFEDFDYDSDKRRGGAFVRTGSDFVSNLAGLPAGPLFGVVGQAITIGSGDNAITFPNITSFINAMKEDKDVHIISTPQIVTLDNKEAEIKVGSNIPYVTKEDTDSTNIDRTVRTFDYRDVGVTLKLTPQINQQGTIRMDVFQEITKLVTGSGTTEFAPTTLKRSATTTVTVPDRTTMVIGGLIDESMDLGNNRVPLLGDVPGLGWLFKTKSRRRQNTNLYIFLTPTVIDSADTSQELYRQKYGEIKELEEKVFDTGKDKKKRKKDRDSGVQEPGVVDEPVQTSRRRPEVHRR